ncbi:AraC family transcriptional regulator [Luteimonas sp. Y-2-2-4F]|nr:AraC family transcriptional regulator [Luteimonas sp. Y-2-2-4F]MCD9030203.1 AraC family transcriptional regulator [Luteimonas sp. Y-2-2-4F]
MTRAVLPEPRPAPAYDEASLAGLRALPGRALATSVDAGWRSTLIERRRWPAGRTELETRASPDLRVSMVLSGAHRTEVLVDGRWRRTDAAPGAAAVTAAGEVDRLRWRSDVPIETIHLFVPADTIASAADQLRRAGTRSSPPDPPLSFDDPAVSSVLQGLLSAAQLGAPDLYAEQATHWLAMHLVLTQRLPAGAEAGGRGMRLAERRLARVLELIRQRYAEPLSLDALAAEACVSKFHFARLFRLRTGMSPHAYLLGERLKAARHLLAATDLPVAEIARRTGFPRAAHFAVAFRKAHGTTATGFRRRHRHPGAGGTP